MKSTTKAILFDMDGTLLPMDIDVFTKAYFVKLTKKIIPHGYDSELLIRGVWHGMGAMIKNDGSCSNEEVFWNVFSGVCGKRAARDRPFFDEFYVNEFNDVKKSCGYDPNAAEAVKAAKESGAIVVLASNPIFPLTAQQNRARWAGIDPALFDYLTSYENCRFCKPDLRYFKDIADSIGVLPEECLMIGNDVDEDMCAADLGMDTFLVTPCMINRRGADISSFHKGDLAALCEYLKE